MTNAFFQPEWQSFVKTKRLALIAGSAFIWLFLAAGDIGAAGKPAASPEAQFQAGLTAFQRGEFADAAEALKSAVKGFEREKDINHVCETRVKLGEAYAGLGQYQIALVELNQALKAVEASPAPDPALKATVLGAIGNLYLTIGPPEKAHSFLEEGAALAGQAKIPRVSAVTLDSLGHFYAATNTPGKAAEAYRQSVAAAEETGDPLLMAWPRIHLAMLSARPEDPSVAIQALQEAEISLQPLPDSFENAQLFISIGASYKMLLEKSPASEKTLLSAGHAALARGARIAAGIGDQRSLSYALGYTGALFEREARYEEALNATREAVFAAQKTQAPECLYLWEWQRGRIFKAMHRTEEAIGAFRRAVESLQPMRNEMSGGFGYTRHLFRESVVPFYVQMVDILLEKAASLSEPERYEPFLMEARERIEDLKVTQFRDYFQDECAVANRLHKTPLDEISSTAAVIYPVILPDRTVLLLSTRLGLRQFTVPVTAEKFKSEVTRFREQLFEQTSRRYVRSGRRLYDWLIRPLEDELSAAKIDTLVFVPYGPLLTIPMAALEDGAHFLIERYAVAVIPSLNLTDPHPIPRENIQLLAMGLTEASQGFPALPFVDEELKGVTSLFGGKVLLNQQFLEHNIEASLLERPYTIVHIASHGQFDKDIDKTFLLTYDGKLTMGELDRCIGFFRFRNTPLELLTLSACQTAAGDEQAALGLAGLAVKAGARSALATLWFVSDQATSDLMAEFYRQLQKPEISKAKALQKAQMKILQDLRYYHPCYWSPFLLINNWL